MQKKKKLSFGKRSQQRRQKFFRFLEKKNILNPKRNFLLFVVLLVAVFFWLPLEDRKVFYFNWQKIIVINQRFCQQANSPLSIPIAKILSCPASLLLDSKTSLLLHSQKSKEHIKEKLDRFHSSLIKKLTK